MRSEFPTSVRASVIKDATRDNGQIYCDQCHLPCKKFQIDHIIADAHGGKNTRENAQLLCEVCYGIKNPKDTTIAAKIKRQTANHIGARTRPIVKLMSAPFAKSERTAKREPKPPISGLPGYTRQIGPHSQSTDRSGAGEGSMIHEHWCVAVSTHGDEIVTIETNMLTGREISDQDKDTIRHAALCLLGFIGEGVESRLSDPSAVHVNMLRGEIAKPTWEQIQHLYPNEFAALRSTKDDPSEGECRSARAAYEAARYRGGYNIEHWREALIAARKAREL